LHGAFVSFQEELSSLQTSLDEQRMRNQSLEIESKRLTEEKSALQGEVDRLVHRLSMPSTPSSPVACFPV